MSDMIRVGLIRCDTHGAYYAALMDQHDPLLLRQPVPVEQKVPYSWMHGGVHYYFYMNFRNATRMTVATVDGFQIVKMWDEHRAASELLARVLGNRPEVCDSFDQVSDDVDLVFIADCNYDGGDHLALARPGLEKGVGTFVDKPLANTRADVKALLSLARDFAAPLYSMSILGGLPAATRFRQRLPELGRADFGNIQGGGAGLGGHIHAIILALHVFGSGVKTVRCMGQTSLAVMHLGYGSQRERPRCGVTISCDVGSTWHCAFFASAYGPKGAIHSPPLNDMEFPDGAARILEIVKDMVVTRQTPADLSIMVEGVAIAEAARRAQQTGDAVAVDSTS